MNSKVWNLVIEKAAAWGGFLRTHGMLRRNTPQAIAFMNPEDALSNPGLCRLYGSAANLPRKTVVVIGIPRGGTSMVAAALQGLGIAMGAAAPPLFEDRILGDLIESRDSERAARIITERNRRHAVWGLKHPSGTLLSPAWRRLFHEPVYVVVFRDPMAVANRRAISREKDLFAEMTVTLDQYASILSLLRNCHRPALLVSYEKALLNPGDFASQLAAFIGVGDEEQIAAAGRLIQPSPSAYRTVARHRAAWAGYLDLVRPDHVAGWAFRTGSPEPATICLSINGQIRMRVLADQPRPDVQEHYAHVTDRCGFAIDLPLQTGDLVSVALANVAEDINNSPQPCP